MTAGLRARELQRRRREAGPNGQCFPIWDDRLAGGVPDRPPSTLAVRGLPHGACNAMLLLAVTAFSLTGAPQRYAACARALGLATRADGAALAGEKLLAGLRSLCADLQVRSPAQCGVARDEFARRVPTMAAQALASPHAANNPVAASHAQVERLYWAAWDCA